MTNLGEHLKLHHIGIVARDEAQIEEFAPCGAVGGVIVRTDAQRGVWKAPAGLDAKLRGVSRLSLSLTGNPAAPGLGRAWHREGSLRATHELVALACAPALLSNCCEEPSVVKRPRAAAPASA